MKINIWNLPTKKLYVKLKRGFVERTINKIRKKYGSCRKFYQKFNFVEGTFFSWRRKCLYPLSVIIKFCKLTNIPLTDIQKNIIELRSRPYPSKTGDISSPIYPKFPIKLTPELTRVIAHMMGDGCLTINKRGHYNFQYYNKCKYLREIFKNDARKIFGELPIHEAINKGVPYVFLPAPVSIIMLSLIPTFNSKISRIPDFIRKAPLETKKEFIKAFMDDEASVKFKPPERRIEIALCNKNLLNDLKNMIEEFGINTTKIQKKICKNKYLSYTFYIRNYHNILKFWKFIDFYHPEKQKKLEKIIKFHGRKSYAHGETKKLILVLLEKKPLSTFELCRTLERSTTNINAFLRKLEREDKVERFKFNRQMSWRVR